MISQENEERLRDELNASKLVDNLLTEHYQNYLPDSHDLLKKEKIEIENMIEEKQKRLKKIEEKLSKPEKGKFKGMVVRNV